MTYFYFALTATGLCVMASFTVRRPKRSIPSLALVVVTFALLFEEALLNGLNQSAGLSLALLATLALPLVGSISRLSEEERYALQACGLMFATRLAFIPFPQTFLKIETTTPSIYALVIALIIAFLILKRISLTKIGLTRGPYSISMQVSAGASIGIFSGIIEYHILKPSPIRLAPDVIQATLYVVIVMTLFVGLGEEMLFRGIIQESYQNLLPPWSAIMIASIQFGIMHYGWLNPLELLFAYGMGLVFGYSFWKTKSLIAPVITHSLGNIVMFHIAAYNEIMLTPNVMALTIIFATVLLLPTVPWQRLPKPEFRTFLPAKPIWGKCRGILKKYFDEISTTTKTWLQALKELRSHASALHKEKETSFEQDIIYLCPYCGRLLIGKEKYCDMCGRQLLPAVNSIEGH